MQEQMLDMLKRLAKALAGQFGPNCEVAVHDLTSGDPQNTIAAIENGHVSNRKVGEGSSHIALEAMRAAPALVLRTGVHPVADYLRKQGIAFTTLDDLHESSEDFDALVQRAVNYLINLAQQGPVVYAVPGEHSDLIINAIAGREAIIGQVMYRLGAMARHVAELEAHN